MPPILYVSIAFLLGVLCAGTLGVVFPWWLLALIASIPVAALLLWWREPRGILWLISGIFFLTGIFRYQWAATTSGDDLIQYHERGALALQGVVIETPDVRDRATDVRILVSRVRLRNEAWQPAQGIVLARLERFVEIEYGAKLELFGVVRAPPEFAAFSYRDYLARQGVYSLMDRPRVTQLYYERADAIPTPWYVSWLSPLFALRQRSHAIITQSLPEPQASLLAGILLGLDRGIPRDTLEAFNLTGTSHLIAISGYNVSILAAYLAHFGSLFVRRRHAWGFVVLGIAVYVIFVGASASVVRAGLMGMLYVWAQATGRRSTAIITLALSALLMAVWSPYVLWDIGFQLSFVATIGLIVMATPLTQWFERHVKKRVAHPTAQRLALTLSDNLWVTVAATIATQPLIVFYFQRLSLISLPVNLLTLPVQPAVMGSGLLVILGGFITPALGQMLGWLAWPFLVWTTAIIEFAARIPFASLELERISFAWVIGYYLVLCAIIVYRRQPPEQRAQIYALWSALQARTRTLALLPILVVLTTWSLGFAFTRTDGHLHVSFLDVGHGDATLIQTPSGRIVVIDGGPSPTSMIAAVGRALPFYRRELALVVLTRASDEKLNGLVPLLDRYTVEQIVAPEISRNNSAARKWRELIAEKTLSLHSATTGLLLDLGDGVLLEVEQVGKAEEGLTLRLRYGAFSVYFDSDAEKFAQPTEPALVWKIARQGDKQAARTDVLQALAPQFAVISAEYNNRFGDPAETTLTRLNAAALTLYRTDLHGTITFRSDGQQLWVETTR